jgi:hypothetical protein
MWRPHAKNPWPRDLNAWLCTLQAQGRWRRSGVHHVCPRLSIKTLKGICSRFFVEYTMCFYLDKTEQKTSLTVRDVRITRGLGCGELIIAFIWVVCATCNLFEQAAPPHWFQWPCKSETGRDFPLCSSAVVPGGVDCCLASGSFSPGQCCLESWSVWCAPQISCYLLEWFLMCVSALVLFVSVAWSGAFQILPFFGFSFGCSVS